MNRPIWPGDLAAIKEIVWRARELVSLRSPGDKGWRRQFKEGDVFVSAKSKLHTFSDTIKHHVDLQLDGAIVYRGDGFVHDDMDMDLLVEGRDALRRIMVLDDLGEIR